MLLGAPLDQRLVSAYQAQADMFAAALDLMELPVERIEIPVGNVMLPGYFLSAGCGWPPAGDRDSDRRL